MKRHVFWSRPCRFCGDRFTPKHTRERECDRCRVILDAPVAVSERYTYLSWAMYWLTVLQLRHVSRRIWT